MPVGFPLSGASGTGTPPPPKTPPAIRPAAIFTAATRPANANLNPANIPTTAAIPMPRPRAASLAMSKNTFLILSL